jgi:glycosyltransferase involved in cell wall biosynthesis
MIGAGEDVHSKRETDNRLRVVLLAPVLAHYRRDVYRELAADERYAFLFVGGKRYLNIKSIEELPQVTLPYLRFAFFGHRFYYLRGVIKTIRAYKPDVIISSGVDFHLLHTLLLFLVNKLFWHKRFYWWSHGTVGHQGRLGWLMRQKFYKGATGVMLYSQSGKSTLQEMHLPENRLQVLGNCLNWEDYGYGAEEQLPTTLADAGEELSLLLVGRLTEKARIPLLLEALAELKYSHKRKVRCRIIGDGDLAYYRDVARGYKLEKSVTFLGPKYGADVHSFFREADLFVYPGSIGLSVLHAFSFGLPVITTDNFDCHGPEVELLQVQVNGGFHKDGDATDLAATIVTWHNRLQTSKNEIAKACLRSIHDKGYTPTQVSEKLLSFIAHE